jgi:hypothetical protein
MTSAMSFVASALANRAEAFRCRDGGEGFD